MSHTNVGEWIELSWDGDAPSEYFVRGHVTDEEFRAEVTRNEGDDACYGTVRRIWAFWAQTGNARENDWNGELMTRDTPGRGKFPVTCAEVTESAECRSRREKFWADQAEKWKREDERRAAEGRP